MSVSKGKYVPDWLATKAPIGLTSDLNVLNGLARVTLQCSMDWLVTKVPNGFASDINVLNGLASDNEAPNAKR